MVAPVIEVEENVLEGLDRMKVPYRLVGSPQSVDLQRDYIQLQSGLYVARQRTLLGRNFNQTDTDLKSQGNLFLTMSEFVEALNHTRDNHPEIYEEITAVRSPWRAEWIGARFNKKGNKMYMTTRNGEEELDEDTLMEDRTPGISIESWLKNPTSQGLPRNDVEKGDLYYFHPRNGSVARFVAGSVWACLNCCGDPSGGGAGLGVRAARRE